MSHSDPPPLAPPTPLDEQGAPFASGIPGLKERFYFHQIIKESSINKHYIIEDISNLAEQTSPVFYYLKQTRYRSAEEFQYAKWFYKRFHNYCHSPFAKTDVTKLQFIFHADGPLDGVYEVITVYEYGDSDRIDVESIEPDQILRFLRNICLLLTELQKFNSIPHGNIFLKNMVLANSELKLSGFKPILLEEGSLYRSWKLALARQYGAVRLDLFLVGLMWLRFLGVELAKVAEPEQPLEKVLRATLKRARALAAPPKQDLLIRLLDVAGEPVISIESVVLDFDEHFVLEDIKAEHRRKNDTVGGGGEANINQTSNSFSHANFNNPGDNSVKASNNYDSGEPGRALGKSESKLSNPFIRAYKDSDHELSNRQDESAPRRPPFDNQSLSQKQRPGGEFLIHGGEYSLQHKHSNGEEGSSRRAKNDHQSLSDMDFDTDHPFDRAFGEPGRSSKHGQKPEERYSSLDPSKESQLRNANALNYDDSRKIVFDDLADAKRISFRSKTFNEADLSLRDSLHGGLKKESPISNNLFRNSQHNKFNSQRDSEREEFGSQGRLAEPGSLDRSGSKGRLADDPHSLTYKHSLHDQAVAANQKDLASNRNSLKSRQSLENSGQQERTSLKSRGSMAKKDSVVAQELENKLFGNRNSVSKQILARESMRKKDGPGSQADLRLDFSKKDPNAQLRESLTSEQAQVRDSRVSGQHRAPEGDLGRQSLSQRGYDSRQSFGGEGLSPNRPSDPVRNSNASKRSQSPIGSLDPTSPVVYRELQGRNSSRLNQRLVADSLQRQWMGDEPADQHSSQRTSGTQRSPSPSLAQRQQYQPDSHERPSHEHDTRGSRLSSRPEDEYHHSLSVRAEQRSPSLDRQSVPERLNTSRGSSSPNRQESLEPFEPSPGSRAGHIEIRNISPSVLISDVFEQREQAERVPSSPPPAQRHSVPDQNPLAEFQAQNIIDPRLLRPSKGVLEGLERSQRHEPRTFSNLDPRAAAKSPSRRRLDPVSGEKETSPLSAVRSKIRDALKVELPEHKKQEIIQKVQREHEEALKQRFYKSWRNKERVAELASQQRQLEQELESGIRRISEAKAEGRRRADSAERRQKEALERVTNVELLEHDYAPIKLLAEALQNEYHSLKQPVGREDLPDRPRGGKSPARGGAEKLGIDELNREVSKQLRHSPIPQRDKFFSYNHEHEVLGVPFRKLVETFQRPDNHMSSAPSLAPLDPNAPAMPGRQARQSASTQAVQNIAESNFDKKFLQNRTKLQIRQELDSVPIFQTLKPSAEGEIPAKRKVQTSAPLSPRMSDVHPLAQSDLFAQTTPELDLNLVQEQPELLVDEIKDFTLFAPRNAFSVPEDVVTAFPDIVDAVAAVKRLHGQGNLAECRRLLDSVGFRQSGLYQMEILKLLAFVYFGLHDTDKARACLLEAMNVLRQQDQLGDKELHFSLLVVNLAFIELYCGEYQEAAKILGNPVFSDSRTQPSFYHNFLGNAHYLADDLPLARHHFAEQLRLELGRPEPDDHLASNILGLVAKVLHCLAREKEKIEPARFFQSIETPVKQLTAIVKGLPLPETSPLRTLPERLVFKFLAFGKANGNGGLLNFILQRVLDKRLFDPLTSLSEPQKTEFCLFLLAACSYLKAKPNYGNFEKNFARYLDLAKKVVNTCDLDLDNLKINLMVLFQKGLYALQRNETAKSQACFDKCIRLYSTFFEGDNAEVYQMLFEIGLAIVRMRRPEQAAFFFEKVVALGGASARLRAEAQRQLGKAYFGLRRFEQCRTVLGSYLKDALFRYDPVAASEQLFKDLCLFFIADVKTKAEDFQPVFETLASQMLFGPRVYVVRYLELFGYLRSGRFTAQSQETLAKVWSDLNAVLVDSSLSQEDQLLKLIALATTLYTQVPVSEGAVGQRDLGLLRLLKDQGLALEANAAIIAQFVFNYIMLVIHLLPGSGVTLETREKQLTSLATLKGLKKAPRIVRELIETVDGVSPDSLTGSVEQLLKERPKGSAPALGRSPSTDNSLPRSSEPLPLELGGLLAEAGVAKEFCKCSKVEEQQYGVTMLIEQFLRQVKNMLFLDVADNLGEYYRRFEAVISEKNWNWYKFGYVKALFDYLIAHEQDAGVDKPSFVQLLDGVFEQPDLCLHDLKLIVMLVESYKRVEYVEILVLFLDRFHPKTAAVVLNLVFLANFNAKHAHIITSFYRKVYSYRYFHLENFPLMHLIDVENVLAVEKELEFRVYTRHRYDVLANPRLREVLRRYIPESTLNDCALKHAFYRTVVALLKPESEGPLEVMLVFQGRLAACELAFGLANAGHSFYLYDLYLLVSLLDLKQDPRLPTLVLQTLKFLEPRLTRDQPFHFAILCSLVGNHFCKLRLFEACIEAKMVALGAMKNLSPGQIAFPPFVMEVDPKSLIFSIIGFLMVGYLELGRLGEAEVFFCKILDFKYENGKLDLEKLLLNVLFELRSGEVGEARQALELARRLFEKMQLNEFLGKMFAATLNRLAYLVAVRTDAAAEVERKRQASEESIKRLIAHR